MPETHGVEQGEDRNIPSARRFVGGLRTHLEQGGQLRP